MLIALWIVNAILALVFAAAGLMKLVRPGEALVASGMSWASDVPAGGVKAVGGVEVLGALGLVLPLATGIAPLLTPAAAIGLALVMAGAIVVHVRLREGFAVPAVLLVLAALSAVLGFLAL